MASGDLRACGRAWEGVGGSWEGVRGRGRAWESYEVSRGEQELAEDGGERRRSRLLFEAHRHRRVQERPEGAVAHARHLDAAQLERCAEADLGWPRLCAMVVEAGDLGRDDGERARVLRLCGKVSAHAEEQVDLRMRALVRAASELGCDRGGRRWGEAITGGRRRPRLTFPSLDASTTTGKSFDSPGSIFRTCACVALDKARAQSWEGGRSLSSFSTVGLTSSSAACKKSRDWPLPAQKGARRRRGRTRAACVHQPDGSGGRATAAAVVRQRLISIFNKWLPHRVSSSEGIQGSSFAG